MNKLRYLRLLILVLPFTIYLLPCLSQTLAPNAPGKDAQWATAGKQGVGTSANLESKVWFTLAQGVMTEVYYPDVTVANVHLLQFAVVNPKTKKVETEQDDPIHQIDPMYGLGLDFEQRNKAKTGEWEIIKSYTTDPDRNSVQISFFVRTKNKDLKFYVYFDPSLANSGMSDTAWSSNGNLLACDGNTCSALIAGGGFGKTSNGFLGQNDGLTQIKQTGNFINFQRAENGNVVQFAELEPTKYSREEMQWTLHKPFVLGFGKTSEEALQTATNTFKQNVNVKAKYQQGWTNYLKTIPKVEPKFQAQFNMAAMILKAHEDKTIRGANIASLTVPWGGGENANENNIGGYHLIWSRDLYQVATAFMALGDKEAALRALDFLFRVQQKPDGSFPQNSFLDGKPFWGSLQLDEVAFPLILAYQLERNDKQTYEKHVKRAADFIAKNGPITPQERWEEESGYSPSTIAAEIAGLVCAADIAQKNGDNESANRWLKTADEWQANIEKWTVTKTGKYSKSAYYLRITQGKPDSGEKLELNNGAGFFDERDIVDAGFLELVRLGIKPADDPIIQNSLNVIDEVIRVKTPNGDGFYRYNHDGYGEMDDGRRWNWDGKYTGKGRLWALLSGERGQYELALANIKGYPTDAVPQVVIAKSRLETMQKFANDGLMIPEQIWDSPTVPKNVDKQFVPELKFGEGSGSATPLAWSMAQFIRLAVNLKEGRNLDTPKVVYDRYVLGKRDEAKIQTFVSDANGFQTNLPLQNRNIADLLALKPGITPNNDVRTDKANVTLDGIDLNDPKIVRPYIKNNEATFSYLETAKEVEIVGDFTGWQPKNLKFTVYTLSHSTLRPFHLTLPFAPTARVEYKLIVDGKWITDPLNPNKVDNGVGGENSFFTMPDYKATEWDKSQDEKINFGLKVERINSKKYGERQVYVYIPKGFEGKSLPTLYLQDGSEYVEKAIALTIQYNLINANKIKPFIMIFLNPKDRNKEYWANDDYAKFLAEEVVPIIDKNYKTIKSREGRAVLGASLGGITAVNIGLKYPNVFGRIGGQSVSWWIDNERIVKDLEKLEGKTKFKFYIDDGTFEGVEDSHKAVEILKKKGFDVDYIESEAGHNWTAWRDRLAEAFIAIWK